MSNAESSCFFAVFLGVSVLGVRLCSRCEIQIQIQIYLSYLIIYFK